MKTSPFFSVVIPVYNVEKYLNECVDSVLCQTFRDIEVILVDDGSLDKSGFICDEYALADDRIRVIHKPNGGVSDARNAGIRIARGEYLLFLDSDDYWDDPKALEIIRSVLDHSADRADIVIFQAKLLYPDGSMQPDHGIFREDFNTLEPQAALEYMASNGLLIGSACSKVVRRAFLLDNNLFFKVGIKSEDIDWLIRLGNCLPKYLYSDQYFYIYRKGRSESITANVDEVYLNQFADMLEGFARDFSYQSEQVRVCLMSIIAYEFSILMAKTANLADAAARRELEDRLLLTCDTLNYDMHPKVRKINAVKKLIGFRGIMALLGIYLRYRKR